MDDAYLSALPVIIALLVLLRLLNNLLKAGFNGLGQISLLSLAERSKQNHIGLKVYLDDPLKLSLASQIFDKFSLFLLGAAVITLKPDISLVGGLLFLLYLVIFDLLLPNAVAAYFAEALVTKLFPTMRWLYALETPLIWTMHRFAAHGRQLEDEDEDEDPEDVKAFLRAGTEEGIIEEKEKSMLRNVIDFGDTVVREVMTPRTDMVCIDHDMSNSMILETFKHSKYSRLPVFRGDIDQIEGFIRFKDFTEVMDSDHPITDYIKPIMFIPENKPISDLLQEMLQKRSQVGIVLDEFGGTAGLITLEDLVEEIVGEIHDEHEEPDSDEIIPLNNGSHLVDGKVLLEDFCEIFEVDVDEEDVDTVGGYIFNNEGRIPNVGDTCMIGGRKIEIAKADKRRIYKVIVAPKGAPAEA
ncbi:MAG: hemolysin family protein [Acidobacteriota bacterium]|nr:hemolysin family protein [Acidobacteriota bacterium]